ncbi:DUF1624 domain-containing protein [Paracoccaceae bacterium]|nr:DUF1624 domain-containing protein [Paracoccaceae bacterium]
MRIHLLDVLRGGLVLAMVIYHFFWDLGYFKFIDLKNITQGLPLLLAQCIGAGFIIVSGISFKLASISDHFRTKFLKRIGVLLLICFLITLITLLLDNKSYIFFGIIHLMVVCSLIGLLLLKIQQNYFLFIIFTLSLIPSISQIKYDLPSYLSWLGINREVPNTNDFYPLFPWVSFYLFGLWVYKPWTSSIVCKKKNNYLDDYKFNYIYKGLRFLGRNSLTVYILHQPIFFSLFLIFIRLSS